MSIPTQPSCCDPVCSTPSTVNLPGEAGAAGAAGENGSAGVSSYSLIIDGFTVPAVGADVSLNASNSSWMVVGQNTFIQNAGGYLVISKASTEEVTVRNLGYSGNAAPGAVIGALQWIAPSGVAGSDIPASVASTLVLKAGDTMTGPLVFTKLTASQTALTYAATTDIDFNGNDYRTLALTGNVTFTTSNKTAGESVVIKILADASIRTFTFPAWIFVGAAAPASIAANKTAILSLTAYGTLDTQTVAAYAAEP